MKKTSIYLLLACLTLLLLPVQAFAGFGISPSTIENDSLKANSRLVQDFVISRSDPTEDMEALITPDLGEMEGWVTFEPGNKVLLPAGQERVPVRAVIQVPADVPTKDFTGYFRVTATPTDAGSGVAVVKGARVDLTLATTGTTVVDFTVRAVEIPDTYEDEPILVVMDVKNDGNTAAGPSKVELEVQDLLENNIKKMESENVGTAPAYEQTEVQTSFAGHELVAGEYYGLVTAYDGAETIYEDRVVFNVMPAKVYETVCTGASEEMVESQDTYMYLAMGAGVAVGAVALFFVFRNKEDEKRNLKLLVVIFGMLIYIGGVYIVFAQDYFDMFSRTCTEQLVEQETITVEEVDEVDEVEDTQEDVQGVAVDNQPEAVVNEQEVDSLRVGLATEDGKYRVYAEEDLSSEVVYFAEEGENLDVLEEKASWYRVEAADGTQGWLPKANAKVDSAE